MGVVGWHVWTVTFRKSVSFGGIVVGVTESKTTNYGEEYTGMCGTVWIKFGCDLLGGVVTFLCVQLDIAFCGD